jgi:MoxR-like ATPase
MSDPALLYEALRDEISRVLIGNEDIVEGLMIALLTDGHVLLEGVPGVAKTTAANLFATATGLSYNRIQMTPDLLPADITGTLVYQEATGEFQLRKGPIFSNIVVADEINRATPKTQSALLEAMQEQQVTIEGDTLKLATPFMVIATQNPIEMEGVFVLPEAQRDRFQLKLTVDLLEREGETELLERFDSTPDFGPETIDQIVTQEDLLEARKTVENVYVDPTIRSYILDLVAETRSTPDTAYGASHRGSIAFLQASKARAAIHGRDYVIPDDVKALAEPVLIHRQVLSTDAELNDLTARDVVRNIVDSIEPPDGSDIQSREPAVGDGGSPTTDDDT